MHNATEDFKKVLQTNRAQKRLNGTRKLAFQQSWLHVNHTYSLSAKNDRKTRSDIDHKRIFFSDDTFSIKKFFTRSVKLTLKRPITFQQEGLQSIKSRRSITVEWLNCEGHPPAIINIPKPPKFEQPKQTSTNSPLNSQEATCTVFKIDYTFTVN